MIPNAANARPIAAVGNANLKPSERFSALIRKLVHCKIATLVTDQAMAEIYRLGIALVSPPGRVVEVHDVQLYSDGVASYRLKV